MLLTTLLTNTKHNVNIKQLNEHAVKTSCRCIHSPPAQFSHAATCKQHKENKDTHQTKAKTR